MSISSNRPLNAQSALTQDTRWSTATCGLTALFAILGHTQLTNVSTIFRIDPRRWSGELNHNVAVVSQTSVIETRSAIVIMTVFVGKTTTIGMMTIETKRTIVEIVGKSVPPDGIR